MKKIYKEPNNSEIETTINVLYGENKIKVPTRVPLDNFDGKTALEVARESYLYHVSQQWCWYYVDDEYEYSCADFGLYYTTVGVDSENNMMENIIDYKTQEEIKKQEEESKKAEEESRKAEEESSKEAASIEESKSIAEAEKESIEAAKEKKDSERNNVFKVVVIVLVALVAIMTIAIIILKRKADRPRKKRVIK